MPRLAALALAGVATGLGAAPAAAPSPPALVVLLATGVEELGDLRFTLG